MCSLTHSPEDVEQRARRQTPEHGPPEPHDLERERESSGGGSQPMALNEKYITMTISSSGGLVGRRLKTYCR